VAQEQFNRTYCALLEQLEQAFNGDPTILGTATRTMFAVKAQAQALMQMPDGAGRAAGPTFDYLAPELRRRPDAEQPSDGLHRTISLHGASSRRPDGGR
jgi:hypothetical protein